MPKPINTKKVATIKEKFNKNIQKHKNLLVSGSLFVLFAVLLTALVTPREKGPIKSYAVGDIAEETIRALENLSITDEEKTENARREAEQSIISIYDYDHTLIKDSSERIEESFRITRDLIGLSKNRGKDFSPQEINKIKEKFNEFSGVEINTQDFLILMRSGFSNIVAQKMIRSLEVLEGKLIVNDLSALTPDIKKGITVRDIGAPTSQKGTYKNDFKDILDTERAKALVNSQASLMFKGYKPGTKKIIFSTLEKFISPNLFINMQLTSSKAAQARDNVKPATIPLQKNEVIVREGDRITKRQSLILEGIKRERRERNMFETQVGLSLTIFLALFLTFLFARSYIRKFKPTSRDIIFILATTILTVLFAKLILYIFSSMADRFPSIPDVSFRFAIPVAAAAMLIRFAINSETSLIFSFILSIIMGFVFEGDLNYAIYCFVGSIAGAHKVAHSQTKFTLIKAGLLTGVINVITALSLLLISGKAFSSGFSLFFSTLFMAMISGLLIAMIMPTLSTIAEASGYLTDIKLMELANYNNPLLNKLALVAPGTYHHSRVVGQLVEVASQSINANPLLAMVMAFYHDVGKIKQPEYFIENQQTSENKHDDLKPSMSRMIIISHVKDGVDFAKEAKIPGQIIDSIEQHHGTSLISFFYKKAKDQENPEVDSVDESEYRYPGPKPQTREIGLLMLADAVEAATKSLTDPTPAQIQGIIQKVFNKIFTDGQLEDCEITLKDLHKIAASFFRVLVSIYKARIDYPDLPPKDGGKKKQNGDSNSKQTKEDKAKPAKNTQDDKGTLKRIGIEKK